MIKRLLLLLQSSWIQLRSSFKAIIVILDWIFLYVVSILTLILSDEFAGTWQWIVTWGKCTCCYKYLLYPLGFYLQRNSFSITQIMAKNANLFYLHMYLRRRRFINGITSMRLRWIILCTCEIQLKYFLWFTHEWGDRIPFYKLKVFDVDSKM